MNAEFQPEPQDESLLAAHQLPHNLDAERSVLGGLLLEPGRFDAIEGRLQEDDFFHPAHGKIYAAMEQIRKDGKPLDILVLNEYLASAKHLETVGGATGLAALLDAVPTGAHVEHYGDIVRQKSMLRRLIRSATDIVEAASHSAATATDILDEAERSIFEVATRGVTSDAESIAQVLKETWERIEKYQDENRTVTGLSAGYHELDSYLSGFHEDELIIVAGRPGMGKSTFALNLLRRMAVEHGEPVVLYTLEMSSENVVRNMLAAQSRINAQHLRNLRLNQEELSHLMMASDALHGAPIFIDDTPAISLAELRGKTRRLKSKHGIKACFVDYLQLMMASTTARNRSREQEVSEISRGLKALAKELKIPVIALAQLSRKSEERKDNRPILSDLRESGAIEQDADVVLLIHRPDYYDAGDDPGQAEVIIAKQRNGPTGIVNLAFLNDQLRFENLSVRPEPDDAAADGF